MSVSRRNKNGLTSLAPFFRLSGGAVALFMLAAPLRAGLYFPPSLIAGEAGVVADLSHFETQGTQLPGVYPVEIWLNGEWAFSQSLRFIPLDRTDGNEDTVSQDNATTNTEGTIRDATGLMACLTRKDFSALRVNMNGLPALAAVGDEVCLSPGGYIPGAWTAFDFQKMRLDISIPQIALQSQARGYVSPELWDEGIAAALLSYSFSGIENQERYGDSRNYYLSLDGGLNLGPWRLRDRRNWTDYSSRYNSYQRWQHGTTTLSRAIIPWSSELTLGDGTSSGEVFESFGFRGARLATEDAMIPDSLRGYAPVIRGSAGTNARVSIRQNGYEVYQTTVAPGEFAISDLYPMYASGDLVVTVTEADGSARTFTVPYSSVPVLVREGRTKYDVTAGKYRMAESRYDDPVVVQGTLVRGLPYGLTAYGGLQYADRYRSAALGAGINMGTLGAISADVTHADSTLNDGSQHQGQSLRFLYARSLNSLGTTFQLTGYRYSTRGFHTLSETALKGMSGWLHDTDRVDAEGRLVEREATGYYNLYDSKRQRVQANIDPTHVMWTWP